MVEFSSLTVQTTDSVSRIINPDVFFFKLDSNGYYLVVQTTYTICWHDFTEKYDHHKRAKSKKISPWRAMTQSEFES